MTTCMMVFFVAAVIMMIVGLVHVARLLKRSAEDDLADLGEAMGLDHRVGLAKLHEAAAPFNKRKS